MNLRFLCVIFATIACLPVSHLLAGEKVFDVTGVIRAPLDTEGQISIAHEDIPGLMPAMTMRFDVTDPKEAMALKAGERVRFRLHVTESDMKVSDFMVIGAEKIPDGERKSKAVVYRLQEGDGVPPFSLVTQDNQPFTEANLRGHLTLLTFVFTRCPRVDYCPLMGTRFGEVQKLVQAEPRFVGKVQLLSISLDPEYDRPEILKAYGKAEGANFAVWQFLTGSKDEVAGLTKAFSVYAERNGVTIDHTLCTALVDGSGHVIRIWRGNRWSADEVVKAIGSP